MRCNRLVLIGLDGVPYTLLKDLADMGVMPNIAGIIKKGVFKKITSTLPEVSAVAWSSIITGENPGSHGIFGFTELDRKTGRLRFPDFDDLKSQPFWQKFPNLKHVIINVPSTYPARPLNGVLVSGFVAPDLRKAVYPKSLLPTLRKISYRTDVDSEKAHRDMNEFLKDVSNTLESSIKLYRHLWKNQKWNVFMYVFTVTDRLMHFLWDAYEDKNNKYNDAFLDYFKRIDKIIGEISYGLKKDDALLIFSDHGFERLEKEVHINNVLRENRLERRAFALDPARIYIERKDKDLTTEIEEVFNSLKIDKKRIINRVFRRDEIYSGSRVKYAPDLVLLSNNGFNLKVKPHSDTISSSAIFTGKHTYEDAFFLSYARRGEYQLDGPSVIAIGKLIDGIIAKKGGRV